MKITAKGKRLTFAQLSKGDVFKTEDSIYLKIKYFSEDGNAFDLNANCLTNFDGSDVIIPLNAELIISEKN